MKKSDDERYAFLQYYNKLDKEERKFIAKFYKEFYFDAISSTPEDERIIKDPDMAKEARRNHNSMKTEAMFRAKKDGALRYLGPEDQQFMEDASDEWEWLDTYKVHGFAGAVVYLNQKAIDEWNAGETDKNLILLSYYECRDRLRKVVNREKIENRKKKR